MHEFNLFRLYAKHNSLSAALRLTFKALSATVKSTSTTPNQVSKP